MPSFETMDNNHRAVLRRKTGVDAHNEPVLGDPEAVWIGVDWDDALVNSQTAEGRTISAVASVPERWPLGSWLWVVPADAGQDAFDDPVGYFLGTGSGDVDDDAETFEVVGYSRSFSLDARHENLMAQLSWVAGALPGDADDL